MGIEVDVEVKIKYAKKLTELEEKLVEYELSSREILLDTNETIYVDDGVTVKFTKTSYGDSYDSIKSHTMYHFDSIKTHINEFMKRKVIDSYEYTSIKARDESMHFTERTSQFISDITSFIILIEKYYPNYKHMDVVKDAGFDKLLERLNFTQDELMNVFPEGDDEYGEC